MRRARLPFFDAARDDWRSAAHGPLAIEFHGPSADMFVREVLPRVHSLRADGCTPARPRRASCYMYDVVDFSLTGYRIG